MEVSRRRVLSGREGMLNRDGNKNCGKKDGFAEGASRAGRRDGGNRSRGGGEKDSTQRGEKDEGQGSEGDAGGLHTAVAVVEGDHGRAEGRDHGEVDRADREIVYSPLPTQWAFHNSKARFKGFSGPIGSGKSQALCQEALKLSYLNPGRTGLIGAPTYPMLRDATQAALLDVLSRNRIPHDLNRAENFLVLRETRSKILFRAVEDFER